MAGRAFPHRPGKEEMAPLVREAGRGKEVAQRDQTAAFSQLEPGLFP